MKTKRAQAMIAGLIYFPFLAIIIINRICSPYLFNDSRFPKEAFFVFLFLSLLYLSFLLIFNRLSFDSKAYFLAFFVFSFLIFLEIIAFFGTYQAPNLTANLINLFAMPSAFLFGALCGAVILTTFMMFFIRFRFKEIGWGFIGLILISFIIPAGRELIYQRQIDIFFGDHRQGKILFASERFFSSDCRKKWASFDLSDRRFHACYGDKDMQEGDLQNSDFLLSEYSYDKDDLSKVYVTNKKTGKILLLAAGESPVWGLED